MSLSRTAPMALGILDFPFTAPPFNGGASLCGSCYRLRKHYGFTVVAPNVPPRAAGVLLPSLACTTFPVGVPNGVQFFIMPGCCMIWINQGTASAEACGQGRWPLILRKVPRAIRGDTLMTYYRIYELDRSTKHIGALHPSHSNRMPKPCSWRAALLIRRPWRSGKEPALSLGLNPPPRQTYH